MSGLLRLLRWPLRVLASVLALVLLYALAVLALGLAPVHRQWQQADARQAITVWVTTNGVHTSLVMPRRTAQIDWSALFDPANARDPQRLSDASRFDMVEVGWGDRYFYLEVPAWRDLNAGIALRALSGLDGAALHVGYTRAPRAAPNAVPLALSPDAYARLVAHLRQSIRLDAQGRAIPIPGHHYDASDAFYEATGHYSLFVTCNEWTRTALSAAGVRMPVWSPLDKPIFWQLRRIPARTAARAG